MAISNTRTRNEYTLDSLTTQFDITFDCVLDDNGNAEELSVWLIENGTYTELDNPDDYTVSALKVVYADAPNHAGAKLLVTRETPLTQLMDFVNNGSYNLQQIEDMSDKLTRIVQEQSTKLDDNSTASKSASDAEDWAVGTRSDGLAPQHTADCSKAWADYVASTVGAHSVSLDYLDNYSANVDAVAGNATNINAVANDLTNIDAVADDLTNIDAVAANETDIDTVAADISDVSTVAADISNVSTVADDKTNIDTVAGISSNVTTVATNMSDINTVVSNLQGILDSFNYGNLSRQYSEGKFLDGTDVQAGDAGYQNNSKYWSDLAAHYVSGGLKYIGTWDTTSQTNYSALGTPRSQGDVFYVVGSGCTIDSVEYKLGDLIIINQDIAFGGTILTSMIDKIDNTETVTPDNTCTLENKTIDGADNTIRCTPTSPPTSQTFDFTKEEALKLDYNNIVITLGSAPYNGFETTVTCSSAIDRGYILFTSPTNTVICVCIHKNETYKFIYATNRWRLKSGAFLVTYDNDVANAPIKDSSLDPSDPGYRYHPNDWASGFGYGDFTIHYNSGTYGVSYYGVPKWSTVIRVSYLGTTRGTAIAMTDDNNTPATYVKALYDNGWTSSWMRVVTNNETQTLTNKTIDAHDNTILNTPINWTTGAVAIDKEAHYILTQQYGLIQPVNPAYIGMRISISSNVDNAYIVCPLNGGYQALCLREGQTVTLIANSATQWRVESGTTFYIDDNAIANAPEKSAGVPYVPCDWKTHLGVGTYNYIYKGSNVKSTYNLPTDNCKVTTTLSEIVTGVGFQGIAEAEMYRTVASPTPMWIRNCASSGWATFWTRIDGTANGTGTVHEITSGFANNWTGNVKWLVRNGICFVNFDVKNSSTSSSEFNILDSGLPNPIFASNYWASVESGYVKCTTGGVFVSGPYLTANKTVFGTISYPVADDWVES